MRTSAAALSCHRSMLATSREPLELDGQVGALMLSEVERGGLEDAGRERAVGLGSGEQRVGCKGRRLLGAGDVTQHDIGYSRRPDLGLRQAEMSPTRVKHRF